MLQVMKRTLCLSIEIWLHDFPFEIIGIRFKNSLVCFYKIIFFNAEQSGRKADEAKICKIWIGKRCKFMLEIRCMLQPQDIFMQKTLNFLP